jgi:hypothetical protein
VAGGYTCQEGGQTYTDKVFDQAFDFPLKCMHGPRPFRHVSSACVTCARGCAAVGPWLMEPLPSRPGDYGRYTEWSEWTCDCGMGWGCSAR